MKPTIRVGIDASSIRAGGGITHLAGILSAVDLEAQGIEQIVVWGGESALSRLPVRTFIDYRLVLSLDRGLAQRAWWQIRGSAEAAGKGCDILFVPGGTYLGSFRPFVTMAQNLLPFSVEDQNRFGSWRKRLRYRLLRRSQSCSFGRAAGIIFVSEYMQNAVVDLGVTGNSRTAVISHGLGQQFLAHPRPALDIAEYSMQRPFRFLYVSIVNAYKHQWNVVEAVATLRREGLPVALDLIGPAESDAHRKLDEAIQAFDPCSEFVQYRGPIPFESLQACYQAADGFVFASSCESFGQILLEAMASGLPIASSNLTSLPEVLGTSGIYFDPLDPQDIARSLRTLVSDQVMRAQLSQSAYERAQTFSWERCSQETFGFLREVFEARTTRCE